MATSENGVACILCRLSGHVWINAGIVAYLVMSSKVPQDSAETALKSKNNVLDLALSWVGYSSRILLVSWSFDRLGCSLRISPDPP
jgi:hypothetical protein